MPKLTVAQRHEIPKWSLSYNGWGNGSGYPGKRGNPAGKYCGLGDTYSCAMGNTTTYGKAGFPMVSMQPGMREGYAYCPDAYAWGRKHRAIINSWDAHVGDLILVNTGGGAQPGHTECIYHVEDRGTHVELFTIGWDSGPSNVDGFRGQGGVHKHVWNSVIGKGNPSIMAVLDADKCVDWSKVDKPEHAKRRAKRKKLTPAPQQKTPDSKTKPGPEHARSFWDRWHWGWWR